MPDLLVEELARLLESIVGIQSYWFFVEHNNDKTSVLVVTKQHLCNASIKFAIKIDKFGGKINKLVWYA